MMVLAKDGVISRPLDNKVHGVQRGLIAIHGDNYSTKSNRDVPHRFLTSLSSIFPIKTAAMVL